ncbi:MAG: RluA family pseudouridine synthase [Ruminococcaceae bacterium]|nr:RluA family pseudouridine synthase [Oscillospiraceae bacterium]
MNILFEDDQIIVCEKPYGMLSQADSAGNESAVSYLEKHTGSSIYPVHRLDKTTKGIMVFAKNSVAAASLSKQITANVFVKEYKATVHGEPKLPSGTFEDLLFYDRRKGKSYVVKRERAGVKKAVLHYKVLEKNENRGGVVSLVHIRLETGRTHQIRVQFASRGFPLLGDRRYGASDKEKEIALCAYRLSFKHPLSGELMDFSI